jgi:hypothetical protein
MTSKEQIFHMKVHSSSKHGYVMLLQGVYVSCLGSPAIFSMLQDNFPAYVHIYYIIYQTQFYINLFMVLIITYIVI